MTGCCDGSLGDSCPCDCHAGLRPSPWMEALELAIEAFLNPTPVHPLLDPAVPLVVVEPAPPAVEPEAVHWPAVEADVRKVHHPAHTAWTADLDLMPAPPPDTGWVWDWIQEWAAQRALETRMLEDMAAILKARPADAPGVILIRYPEETVMVESQWLDPGTLVYSMPDQPDLMVKMDPDGPGVLYYRQTKPA